MKEDNACRTSLTVAGKEINIKPGKTNKKNSVQSGRFRVVAVLEKKNR